ncbi:NtrC family signal transduction histidine kinase [Ignavibacterium album JCM 16511]|uniref:histidine kinase n=2 Tax=Ignavibacterium album TaxID=591197 RepID=I0AG68_IGNAJ|nr:NtrC family signal transduction histidine kinase [Ignavibacterium album JCM 16511]
MKFQIKLPPKAIISISAIIALVMIISSYVELNQSKNEIYQLLYEHSVTLLQSIIISSENTLNSGFEIEDIITERLLDNARLIRKLDSLNALNKDELIKIATGNNLYRVNVFDKKGNRILSNRIPEPGDIHGEENINRFSELEPILKGQTEELIIGLKKAEFSDGERYAVAVARANNKGAIVVNMDAKDFLEFRKRIGIGVILQGISNHHGIEYIILQDTLGVLAATAKIDTVESISESGFLHSVIESDSVFSRVIKINGSELYEVSKRFMLNNELVGIYRVGLSLEDVRKVESRMIRRLIIISLILAAISIIVLSIIFTNQNLKSISDEYQRFKTFASSVLENMSEAVIVFNKQGIISFINSSAEKLFNISAEDYLNKELYDLNNSVSETFLKKISLNENKSFEFDISINNEIKTLFCSLSELTEEKSDSNYIAVIRDITEVKILEEEARRNEKLSAMGELASGVAHEIRNPINAIGMIAQRLNKEFTPNENEQEYKKITGLLRSEVNRINKIITQFLNYAKPLELKISQIRCSDFFEEIYQLFIPQANQKNIKFIKQGDDNLMVRFDADLIKQSLMNIIQNAFDAVNEKGEVLLKYYQSGNHFIIEISDNGFGIPPELQKKIFDLYFTTKKDGNGLGLSIAQKIINQHNGTITISSKINQGTTFKISLPI